MILGLRCTDYSATIYAEDDPDAEPDEMAEDSMAEAARNAAAAEKADGSGHEEEKKNLAKPAEEEEKESLGERIMMTLVMIVSLVIALGLFMALPVFLASHDLYSSDLTDEGYPQALPVSRGRAQMHQLSGERT